MAGFTAIADVGVALVGLLKDRMTDLDLGDLDEKILLASPMDVGDNDSVVLTLYLYRVAENPQLKNAPDREVRPAGDGAVDPGTLQPSPMALDLYYLLTAYPSDTASGSLTAESVSQHRVLGRAMQVLRDNAALRGPDLQGALADDETVRVSVYPESAEDVLSLWNTFTERPYRPSVTYLVGPVEIESERTAPVPRATGRTVVTRQLRSDETAGEEESP